MKYVRTEDGLFDKVSEDLVYASKPPMYQLTKNGVHVKYEFCHKCQLADTIPELCDGDVLFESGQLKKVHLYKEGYGFNEYGSKLSANQYVVLFITTNKGLIYVAKMKGVLPNGEIDWELL